MRWNPCVLGTPFSRVKYPPKRAKKGVFCIEDKGRKWRFLLKRGQKRGVKRGVFTWEIRDRQVAFNVGKLGSGGLEKGQKGGFWVQKGGVSVIREGRFGPHNLAQLNFF